MSTEERAEDTQVSETLAYTQSKHIKFEYTWIIEDYEKRDSQVKSPVFSPGCNGKLKWYLVTTTSWNSYRAELFLRLLPCNTSEILVRNTASLLYGNGKKAVTLNTNETCKSVSATEEIEYTFAGSFIRAAIRDPSNGLLPGGNLTILCEIELEVNLFCVPGDSPVIKVPECELHDDMGHLLETQKLTDVTIVVCKQKLPAHKLILSARSNVFAAMFEHEMAEKQRNVVDVTDVEPEVMRELLRYIYTGRVTLIETMADKLLMAAAKYELKRLTLMCVETLRTKLTPENAVDILILADLLNVDQLKACAMDYIVLNAAEVMETPSFKAMINSHPYMIAEILRVSTIRRSAEPENSMMNLIS